MTQSNAILRYIARKHKLLGNSEVECVRVDVMENQLMDFRNGFVRLCYNPNFVSKLCDIIAIFIPGTACVEETKGTVSLRLVVAKPFLQGWNFFRLQA